MTINKMKIYKTQNNYYYKVLKNGNKIRISKTEFNKLQQEGAGIFDYLFGTSEQNSSKTQQDNELTKMKKDIDIEIDRLHNQIKTKSEKLQELKERRYARARSGFYRREINPQNPSTKPLRDKLDKQIDNLIEEIKFLNEKKTDLMYATLEIEREDEKKAIEQVLSKYAGTRARGQNIGTIIGPKIRHNLKLYDNRKRPRNNNNNNNNTRPPPSQRSRINTGQQRQ